MVYLNTETRDSYNARKEHLRFVQKYYSLHHEDLKGLTPEVKFWASSCYTTFLANNAVAEAQWNTSIEAAIEEAKAFNCLEKSYLSLKTVAIELFEPNDKRFDKYSVLLPYPDSRDNQLTFIHHIVDEHELNLRLHGKPDFPLSAIIQLKAAFNSAMKAHATYTIVKEEALIARKSFIQQWKLDSYYLTTQSQWKLDGYEHQAVPLSVKHVLAA